MYQETTDWCALPHRATHWTRLEDKVFEQALVAYPETLPDRWLRIANDLPGRTAADVREHYDALVHDVGEIDSGRVEIPSYPDEATELSGWDPAGQISFGSKQKHGEVERKKGTPWTEEEHKLFLIGLHRYGKGDWRSISRNVVVTRTPTQVASHAQKYFLRQNSGKKERKRSSIHDITTADSNLVPMSPVNQQLGLSPSNNQVLQQQQQQQQQFPMSTQLSDQVNMFGYGSYGRLM